jgi:L-fucose isomerase-like protein
MEQDGADLIVFVVGSWVFFDHHFGCERSPRSRGSLWPIRPGGQRQHRCSAAGALCAPGDGQLPFFLSGTIDDGENSAPSGNNRAAWVRRTLRNRRIATIGGKCMMMYQTGQRVDWKAVFGVDFPQHDAVQVFTEMDKVDEPKHAGSSRVPGAGGHGALAVGYRRADLRGRDSETGQAVSGFPRMQELYGIDVFANKCMPRCRMKATAFGYAGCLATCMLNDAGIMIACEADLPAALSMYILRLLSGQAVFRRYRPVNKPDKRITFFNCGTAPISMADRNKEVSLWPNPSILSDEAVPDEYFINHMKGACIHFDLEEGREVTLLRIGGNGDTLRFHVANGRTSRRDVQPEEVLGHRYPGFGLEFQEDVDLFLNNCTGHHYVLSWGDHAEELRHLAHILGIKYVYNR